MRIIGFFLVWALLLNGYCAAAHAFGETMPSPVKSEGMKMQNCHGMSAEQGDAAKHPVSSGMGKMNCKACCVSGMELVYLNVIYFAKNEICRFPVAQETVPDAPPQSIFHPPKTPV